MRAQAEPGYEGNVAKAEEKCLPLGVGIGIGIVAERASVPGSSNMAKTQEEYPEDFAASATSFWIFDLRLGKRGAASSLLPTLHFAFGVPYSPLPPVVARHQPW